MVTNLQRSPTDSGSVKQAKQKARSAIKKVYQKQLRESQTPAEKHLWEALKDNQTGFKFTQQAIVRGFIPDFWCSKMNLAIEVDGKVHLKQQSYDRWRETILKSYKVHILRFTNEEVFNDRDKCIAAILSKIEKINTARTKNKTTLKKPKWKSKPMARRLERNLE